MKPQRVGDIQISRISEIELPFRTPDLIFPDYQATVFEEHQDWLEPLFVSSETGELIFGFHSFLLKTPKHNILIDTCLGNHKDRHELPLWHMRQGTYLQDLQSMGVRPEEIDFVMCTHLHADHVGWNTQLINGRWVPTFQNAQYIFSKKEYYHWKEIYDKDPSARLNRGSFADSVLPIIEQKRAVLVDDDYQLDDTVWFEPAPGHTPGNVVVKIRSKHQNATVFGDVMHHPVQLAKPAWSSKFCEDPVQSAKTRIALIEEHADTSTLIFNAHFPSPTVGTIVRHKDGFKLKI